VRVLWGVLGGVFLAGISVGMLVVVLEPARDIWRGDAHRLPHLSEVPVNARSYLVLLLWSVPLMSALGLLGVAVGANAVGVPLAIVKPIAIIGIAAACIGLPFIPLQWVVSAFGHPKFLIPPPYRDHPGGFARARERRRRKRAGVAPTDHVIEFLDIKPVPGTDLEPYLHAVCTDPECDWSAYADAKLIGITEEHQLREKAARHTTVTIINVRTPRADG
jgi:hypothetical protein